MTDDAARDAIGRQLVVFTLPGMETVEISRNRVYRSTESGPLQLDLYLPQSDTRPASVPAIVLVAGYPDPTGRFRRMGWATSWARLIAASGMAAVVYGNEDPTADLRAVFGHLRAHAGELSIDGSRIGVLASSGSVPVALDVCLEPPLAVCAALFYGFTLDPPGSTKVADAARTYGFANPTAGRSAAEWPAALPLFIARAGRDTFDGLNDALDAFVGVALAANRPVTVVNHATGPHAFDLFDDSAPTRLIIRQALEFLQGQLER